MTSTTSLVLSEKEPKRYLAPTVPLLKDVMFSINKKKTHLSTSLFAM